MVPGLCTALLSLARLLHPGLSSGYLGTLNCFVSLDKVGGREDP